MPVTKTDNPVQIPARVLEVSRPETVQEIPRWIRENNENIPLFGDMTINMLCENTHLTGIYTCFDPVSEKILYVGKASSRSFPDRVAAHCDYREGAWFGTMTRYALENVPEVSNLAEASAWLRRNTKVCLLPVDPSLAAGGADYKAFVRNLEARLQKPAPEGLGPSWNNPSRQGKAAKTSARGARSVPERGQPD